MKICVILVFALFVIVSNAELEDEYENDEDDESELTNSWAVELDTDDEAVAREIAEIHGYNYEGRVGNLKRHFHLSRDDDHGEEDSKRGDITYPELHEHPNVKWHERQRTLPLVKRAMTKRREKREPSPEFYNDPDLKYQWYIKSFGKDNIPAGYDMRIMDAWGMGYKGKGIVVSVMDDGLDHKNPDLKKNFDKKASTNLNDNNNNGGWKGDPIPRDQSDQYHGTKCGGEIAATPNNNFCGVGIAPEVSIGGIRMLDGKVTGMTEGKAFSHNKRETDIYSASWGPKDNGMTMSGPSNLGRRALKDGTVSGRNGKGNLYVWASGNGGTSFDDCNADGYVANIHTMAIGSVSAAGRKTYYDETCPSTLAVVYSGDSDKSRTSLGGMHKLVTTGSHGSCVEHFGGTSAAAPLAAGIFALLLDANDALTWRDVQHLVVHTARRIRPDDKQWKRNAAGFLFHDEHGVGLLDAVALIKKGLTWKTVPAQKRCVVKATLPLKRVISANGELEVKVRSDGCAGSENFIKRLEHVQAVVKMSTKIKNRGALSFELRSPGKMISHLLKPRPLDESTKGIDWPFMSLRYWGENPAGEWTLKIRDNSETVAQMRRKRFRFRRSDDGLRAGQEEDEREYRAEDEREYRAEDEREYRAEDEREYRAEDEREYRAEDEREYRAEDAAEDELFRPEVTLEDEEEGNEDYRRDFEEEEEQPKSPDSLVALNLVLWGTSE